MRYPGKLDEAVNAWLATHGKGKDVAARMRELSASYRAGESSSQVSLTAYLTARLPATFAACAEVFRRVREVVPDFAPKSILDTGAGPGTAAWAALAQWPTVSDVTQIERDTRFAALAKSLNAQSGLVALESATLRQESVQTSPGFPNDLVIASYLLAEIPEDQSTSLALKIWQAAQAMLILIEPGTPQGFARLLSARIALLEHGAHIVAPCTHALACPMARGDWCHFKVRLARSRAHMQAKGAVVPFEDEAFSYLAVSREPVALAGARILGPVSKDKVAVSYASCADGRLSNQSVASRDKAHYKQAKKLQWGDRVSVHQPG